MRDIRVWVSWTVLQYQYEIPANTRRNPYTIDVMIPVKNTWKYSTPNSSMRAISPKMGKNNPVSINRTEFIER